LKEGKIFAVAKKFSLDSHAIRELFKKIGFGFLLGASINAGFAALDMRPSVEEWDGHESGIARLILGGGGVLSLARTFQVGSRSKAPGILSKQEPLSLPLIRELYTKGNIPPTLLIKPYALRES